ncbi:hypothetical protein KSB_36210 [Ktedonobacter robiniae]|uniref:Uncharacterized protein n=1 Tax=Ktedonobacter robiniae TaxID=2778365 RepID=A0ABQ3UQT9_9CHLR|nr:hypothetical protein KSB_36210 [Ktedonobacter robiniae]
MYGECGIVAAQPPLSCWKQQFSELHSYNTIPETTLLNARVYISWDEEGRGTTLLKHASTYHGAEKGNHSA